MTDPLLGSPGDHSVALFASALFSHLLTSFFFFIMYYAIRLFFSSRFSSSTSSSSSSSASSASSFLLLRLHFSNFWQRTVVQLLTAKVNHQGGVLVNPCPNSKFDSRPAERQKHGKAEGGPAFDGSTPGADNWR